MNKLKITRETQASELNLQPELENKIIKIRPLRNDDFETLFEIASDPLIWEQHPNKDRYKRDVFEKFFKGAIESGGAFMIYDNEKNLPIGCSRYYDCNESDKTIAIGFTFLARKNWGTTYNRALKELMLNHAFEFADKVYFHIGEKNIRSQKATAKIGAVKIDEQNRTNYGESSHLTFVYELTREDWIESFKGNSLS